MLGIILLVFALVLFIIGAFWYPLGNPVTPNAPTPVWGRFNPISAGLAFLTAYYLFSGIVRLH